MIKLGIVVGHELDKPGASLNFLGHEHEYQYNHMLALAIKKCGALYGVDVEIFMRDGIGISGSHKQAEEWGAEVVIELHFNSHSDASVKGAEVLTTVQYHTLNGFADEMALVMSNIFSGPNRGVKYPLTPENDGHPNVYRPVPTYLLEPFFGSNAEQAELANRNEIPYAKAILIAVQKYFG